MKIQGKEYRTIWYEGNIAAHTKQISNYKVHNDGNWDGLKNIRKHNDY